MIINNQNIIDIFIKKKDIEICKLIIKNGFNLDNKNKYGFKIIHLACQYNFIDLVKYIYNYDFKYINCIDNSFNIHPLFICIIYNNFEIFKFLFSCKEINKDIIWIRKNKNNYYSLINLCIDLNRNKIGEYLIDEIYKQNINFYTYLKCINNDNLYFLKLLPVKLNILNQFINEKTILNYAIDKVNYNLNSINIVKYLIDIGVKLEYENKTQPIIQIVNKNNIELLNYILKKKN